MVCRQLSLFKINGLIHLGRPRRTAVFFFRLVVQIVGAPSFMHLFARPLSGAAAEASSPDDPCPPASA